MGSPLGQMVEFGRYRITAAKREVLADGKPLLLGDRAFDVLICLLEARGGLVGKNDLINAVWPGQIVEENALQAQISALRKALGADRGLIKTVAGRGYQFTGEVRTGVSATMEAASTLQQSISELIGRDEQVQQVLDLLTRQRLVSLCGPGGIGKTRLALEVARLLLARFAGRVCIAKLAPLAHPRLVPSTVANALGVALAGGRVTAERIAAAIGSQPMVLVLDNCEHVVGAAAVLVETLLHHTPAARVLVTSTEPLRLDGENVHRVPSLELPTEKDPPDDVMRAGSIRLLLARMRETDPQFTPDSDALSMMASICRRLDGIPLALELAASRAAALGIDAVSSRLDDRFRILTGGKRTAMPRHQTLRATLDWSYDLLPESERVILRRLSVFAGAVPLSVAARVVAGGELTEAELLDGIGNLVSKSLVMRDAAARTYRLLESTRAYAHEKLSESGELDAIARQHAEQYRDLFHQAELDWESQPTTHWLTTYEPYLDDLRAALDWAFSVAGEEHAAIDLTACAVPLLFHLSLIEECLARVEDALERVPSAEHVSEHRIMQLHATHGWSLMYTTGPARETGAAWSDTLKLAERLGSTDYQLRALWGLWAGGINNGEFTAALELSQRFRHVAENSSEPTDWLVGARMMAQSLHFLGKQSEALVLIEDMLRQYKPPHRRSHVVRFQFDQRVTARITLARVLWLRGRADQAFRQVDIGIEEALSLSHSLSLGNLLAQAACPITLLAGRLELAGHYLDMFVETATTNALYVWRIYGQCFRGMLSIRLGDVNGGVTQLSEAIDELRQAKFVQYLTAFLLAQAEGLAQVNRVDQAIAATNEALARVERSNERWCLPELLRTQGELALLQTATQSKAEEYFKQAIDLAHAQGALSWELRAATSLARLYQTQGSAAQGKKLLAPVLQAFTEGLDSHDVISAVTLLRALQQQN